MKITWEAKDIWPGRRVQKPGSGEVWIVGYDPTWSFPDSDTKYCVISLNDGMISHNHITLEQVAEQLTKAGDVPVELLADGNWPRCKE